MSFSVGSRRNREKWAWTVAVRERERERERERGKETSARHNDDDGDGRVGEFEGDRVRQGAQVAQHGGEMGEANDWCRLHGLALRLSRSAVPF